MHIIIQYILNLSHTLNLNHNGITPKQYVITRDESYTHHTILIYTWHTHRLYLWTMQYTQLLSYFQNHFKSLCLWLNSSDSHNGSHHNTHRAKLVALKGSYSCVIAQFIAHNTIHILISMYSIIHHMFKSPHTQNLNHHFISSI